MLYIPEEEFGVLEYLSKYSGTLDEQELLASTQRLGLPSDISLVDALDIIEWLFDNGLIRCPDKKGKPVGSLKGSPLTRWQGVRLTPEGKMRLRNRARHCRYP